MIIIIIIIITWNNGTINLLPNPSFFLLNKLQSTLLKFFMILSYFFRILLNKRRKAKIKNFFRALKIVYYQIDKKYYHK